MMTLQDFRQQYPMYDDMSDADLSASLHQKFYSDIPLADFQQKIGAVPAPAAAAAPATASPAAESLIGSGAPVQKTPLLQSIREGLGDSSTGVAKGLTANFSDELFAGGMTPIEMGISAYKGQDTSPLLAYSRALSKMREQDKQAAERSPIAATAGEVAGGLMAGGGLAKNGFTFMNAGRASIPGLAGRGAAEGALYGGAYGAGDGEDLGDRLSKAQRGVAVGAGTGLLTGALAGRMARTNASNSIRDLGTLKADSQAKYDAAEKADVTLKPQSFGAMVSDLQTKLANEAIDQTLTPASLAAFKRIEDVAASPGAPTFKGLEVLRKVTQHASTAAKKNEADGRLVGIIRDHIDNYVQGMGPADVLTGNPDVAKNAIVTARRDWRAFTKGTAVGDAKNAAGLFAQKDQTAGLRSEFRKIARNKKLMQTYTGDEQSLIKRIAKGSTTEKALRVIGEFHPTMHILKSGVGTAAALQTLGPAGLALPAAALVARPAANMMTHSNVNRLDQLIRSGGNLPTPRLTARQRALLESLMVGGLSPASSP